MIINGLTCKHCGGRLEAIRIVRSVVHTRCPGCNTTSEPEPVNVKSKLTIAQGLKKKLRSVDVVYRRKNR